MEERCYNCNFRHKLKHNFVQYYGFEESYACDVLLHLPKEEGKIDCFPWIQEVSDDDCCEMFSRKNLND